MNAFPPELHSYICHLACTDAGNTSRALTLVSSYFREIAKPFLYQSLALSGVAQIIELASKIETLPPHLRQIRHLYLSEQSYRYADQALLAESSSKKIAKLISLAAPTLETLVITGPAPASIFTTAFLAQLLRTSFPQLRELTIHGFYPFPTSRSKLPALQRLHLAGYRNPVGLLSGGLDAACPTLTHLRVSGLNTAVSFVHELEGALKREDVEIELFPAQFPTHLRMMVVQPGLPVSCEGRNAGARLKDSAMMKRLDDISSLSDMNKGVGIQVLERRNLDCAVLKQQWLNRLNGGEGCWAG